MNFNGIFSTCSHIFMVNIKAGTDNLGPVRIRVLECSLPVMYGSYSSFFVRYLFHSDLRMSCENEICLLFPNLCNSVPYPPFCNFFILYSFHRAILYA